MKLYHDPSSRSVRPLIVLEELGVPYELEPVSLERGEHKTPEHLERHPLGQLPVLEDGENTLFESTAICLYLAERHPESGLRPSAGAELGLYYQWCCFVPGSLEPAISGAYLELQGTALPPGTPKLDRVLAALSEPLERRAYLLPSGFSTADVVAGHTLLSLSRFLEPPPVLRRYLDRLQARPAFQKASPRG